MSANIQPHCYTSYFAKAGNHPQAVSIARFSPKWFRGPRLIILAPKSTWLKLSEPTYRRYYSELLESLNVTRIAAEVKGKILCCYETPDKFCHRQMVAEWLTEKLGVLVVEWTEPNETPALFPK